MPLKKNKSIGEFPRIKISEEFPRVKISTEFPRKSIVTEPPFGKDIVNLEKKYGTVSGYKMYPYGRAKEDFVEQEHPRDEGGQFTDKGDSQSKITRDRTFGRILDIHKGYIDRLEGRIQKMRRRLEIEPENTLNYKGWYLQLDSMERNLERRIKDTSKAIADRKAFNEMGLFEVDMGKNTHPIGSRGFKNGITQNKIKDWKIETGRGGHLSVKESGYRVLESEWDDRVKGRTIIDSNISSTAEPEVLELQNEVLHVWNELLSDEQRRSVDVLKIRYTDEPKWKMEKGESKRTLGSHGERKIFNMEKLGEKMMLAPSILTMYLARGDNVNDVLNTVLHELGHARWAKEIVPNKEKMNKFTDKIINMGKEKSLTNYSASYFDDLGEVKQDYDKEVEKINKNFSKVDQPENKQHFLDEAKKHHEENIYKAKQLIANETHSEYFAMVGSPTDRDYHTIGEAKLKEMSKMLKEDLYD